MVPDIVRAHTGRDLIVRANPEGHPDSWPTAAAVRLAGGDHAAEVQWT